MEFLPAFRTATVRLKRGGKIRQRDIELKALTDEKECQTASTPSMLVDVSVVPLVCEHLYHQERNRTGDVPL